MTSDLAAVGAADPVLQTAAAAGGQTASLAEPRGASLAVPTTAVVRRVASVDVLRGLVIGLMVFVNTIPGVRGVPAFTQHLPGSVDGYSLADMIFPWFLFLVGVSLPLALGRAVAEQQRWRAFGRLVPRAAGLLVLGIIFVNHERMASERTGINGHAWLLMCVGAMAVLLAVRAPDPNRSGPTKELFPTWLKIVAVAGLVVLFGIFRGHASGGRITWLESSWWGILGIIGWAYFVGALGFLATRGRLWLLAGLQVAAVIICILTAEGFEGPLALLSPLISPHDFLGSLTGVVISGAIAGVLLLSKGNRALPWLAGFGLLLWIAGALLRPLHGYSKLEATESWALVAAGQASLMLAMFHTLLDRQPRKGGDAPWWQRGLGWVGAAGKNALLAYLLSELLYPICRLIDVSITPGNQVGGAAAMLNAFAIAVGVLAVAAFASQRRIFLRL